MIRTKKKGLLVVISGPSGAGKDSVLQKARENNSNLYESISCTSRKMRMGEVEGKDYFFLTKEEFEDKINNNEFLEYAEYAGNYYGTPKRNVRKMLDSGKDVVLVIEIKGALQIKKLVSDALFIFIMPPSMDILIKRLINRKTDSKDKILERFKTAYQEINEVTKYNYVIVNDDLTEASFKLNCILQTQRCRVDRIEEVFLNNKEEEMHEILLDNKIFDNNEKEF